MSYYYPRAAIELRLLPEDFMNKTDASKQTPQRLLVQAKDVTINRNDYRTTDTFSLEIDYNSFPFDPRTIRACGVAIYVQDVGANYNEDGSVKKIIPGDTDVITGASNCIFLGFADTDEIVFDDNGRKVKMEGRDCTALLIDQKYQVNTPIFPTQPLDVVLKTLLSTFKATSEIQIVNNTGSPVFPTISQYQPNFGDKYANGLNTGGGKRETYWDIIMDLCDRAGLICYMGTTSKNGKIFPALYLSSPKNQGLGIDPITGQPATETLDDIKIIYGKNVRSLNFKRKLGRLKGFNIQVRSRVGKKVIIAKIPEEATAAWGIGFGFQQQGGISADPSSPATNFAPIQIPVLKPDGSLDTTQNHIAPYITFNFPKVSTHAALVQIGQHIYEQYSFQQLEGEFSTKEMLGRGTTKSNKTSFKQYDMTQIVKGQTFCIEIDPDDLADISRLATIGERTDCLIRHGYDRNVASIFASTLGKMSPRFQLKSYSLNVNESNGFKLDVQFQSIIDISQRTISS